MASGYPRNTGPMLSSARCGAKTRSDDRAGHQRSAAKSAAECTAGSGAPRGNQNALKHGVFTKEAIDERRNVRALMGQPRKLLQQLK